MDYKCISLSMLNILQRILKYMIFASVSLYTTNQTNDKVLTYIGKSLAISLYLVLLEYFINNLCRDVKETFTPIIEESNTQINQTELKDIEPLKQAKADAEVDKLKEERLKEEELYDDKPQTIEYGYSFVHPSAMKLPEIRIPKCVGDQSCTACPVMLGGTNDLLEVKPTKKPECCD